MTPGSAAAIAAAVLLLAACGSGTDDTSAQPEETSTASTTASQPADASPSETAVTDCAELLRDGWQPPAEEAPDISWDPETGVARITFTEDQLVVNILDDPQCQRLPVIGKMVKQIVDSASR